MTNQDFRKTTSGITLGKKLFTGQTITASQITSLLIQAGVPIPKEVIVTADVAQILLAGGAISTGSASINSFLGKGTGMAGVSSAALQLLNITGLVNPNSPTGQVLTIGTDVAMIVATSGLNVLADVKFILDMVNIIGNWEGKAKADAQNALAQVIANRERPQQTAAAFSFKDYQQGKMSVFQLMGQIADEAPDFFLTYFPQLKGFVPTYDITFTAHTSDTSWWGDHNSFDASQTIVSIENAKNLIQTGIFNKYVGVPLSGFQNIFLASQNGSLQAGESRELLDPTTFGNLRKFGFPKNSIPYHPNPINRMSLNALAALSMMPPYIQKFPIGFDIGEYLQVLNLTPSDFNDDVISYAVRNPDFFPNGTPEVTPSYTYNGVDYYSPAQQNIINQNKINMQISTAEQKNFIQYDKAGWISSLRADNLGKQIVKEWGTLPVVTPNDVNQPNWYKQYGLPYSPYQGIDISQYWSALCMQDQILKDPYFTDFQRDMSFNFTQMANSITMLHSSLQFKSVCRSLNMKALENVAMFLNTAPTNLKLLKVGNGQGQTSVFGYKK